MCLLTRIDEIADSNITIHRATGLSAAGMNGLQRPFSDSQLKGFSGMVPGEAGNGSASGLVISAVNEPAIRVN